MGQLNVQPYLNNLHTSDSICKVNLNKPVLGSWCALNDDTISCAEVTFQETELTNAKFKYKMTTLLQLFLELKTSCTYIHNEPSQLNCKPLAGAPSCSRLT